MRKKGIIVLLFSASLVSPFFCWSLEMSESLLPLQLSRFSLLFAQTFSQQPPFAGSLCPKHKPLFHAPGSSNIISSVVFSSLAVGTDSQVTSFSIFSLFQLYNTHVTVSFIKFPQLKQHDFCFSSQTRTDSVCSSDSAFSTMTQFLLFLMTTSLANEWRKKHRE